MSNLITNPTTSADNTVNAPTGVVALSLNSADQDAIDALSEDGAGGYFQSNTSYGVMGTSAYGTSGWFSPQTSGNTQPTVVIQSIGGTSDQLQVQDINGASLLSIKDSGLLLLADAHTETASAANRGAIRVVRGGAGVADQFQVCLKAANGTYSFVTK